LLLTATSRWIYTGISRTPGGVPPGGVARDCGPIPTKGLLLKRPPRLPKNRMRLSLCTGRKNPIETIKTLEYDTLGAGQGFGIRVLTSIIGRW
jgi:hypothetical protein